MIWLAVVAPPVQNGSYLLPDTPAHFPSCPLEEKFDQGSARNKIDSFSRICCSGWMCLCYVEICLVEAEHWCWVFSKLRKTSGTF